MNWDTAAVLAEVPGVPTGAAVGAGAGVSGGAVDAGGAGGEGGDGVAYGKLTVDPRSRLAVLA